MMIRMAKAFIVILVLVLAACGGQPAPTATIVPPTAVPATPESTSDAGPPPVFADVQVTVAFAQPGTLIPSSGGTIAAPGAAPFTFDRIIFTQTGGVAGVNNRIDIYSDGRVIRNGTESQASDETIATLVTMLDTIDFFNLGGQFVSPGAMADAFTYSLTVIAGGSSRTLTSQDGFTPPPLFEIYDLIRAQG